MYDAGRGVPGDAAEAFKWYRRAAKQGHATAQYNLGVMYAKGDGVETDRVEAYVWFTLATARGDEEAKKIRDIARRLLSPKMLEVAEARIRALSAGRVDPVTEFE